jgi:hypothetical protein
VADLKIPGYRDLIVKGIDLLERWITAYERRLDFEERRDIRIAESAASRELRAIDREERLQAKTDAGIKSAGPAAAPGSAEKWSRPSTGRAHRTCLTVLMSFPVVTGIKIDLVRLGLAAEKLRP